jgi:hypothetical protein
LFFNPPWRSSSPSAADCDIPAKANHPIAGRSSPAPGTPVDAEEQLGISGKGVHPCNRPRQIIVHHRIYPGEAVLVVIILAIVYLLIRGPVDRIVQGEYKT